MNRRIFPLVLAVIGSTVALRAEATPAQRIALRLDYQPDPSHGCPTPDELGFMLAAEFGYPIVRDDATGSLRVVIRATGGKYEAELSAPNPSGTVEDWQWRTDKQATCRELAYDVATTVGIALGPRAWPSDQPPVTLAAPPPIIDVQKSAVLVMDPQQDRLAAFMPTVVPHSISASTPSESTETPVQMEAALGPVVTLYGLPSVAIGGSGLLALRWTRFAVGLDLRAVITPVKGIGERDVPGRTSMWTASALPCGIARFVDVCGIVSVSAMRFDFDPSVITGAGDNLSAGFGARVAPRWQLGKGFTLMAYADVTGEIRTIGVRMTKGDQASETATEWFSPSIRASVGLVLTTSVVK